VIANPDDDEPRAVYADHLIDHGDPRGTFIALQLALAKTEPGPKRDEIAAEAAALEERHRATWNREITLYTLQHHYRRGFIFAIEARGRSFAAHGERLVALAPIERLRLRTLDRSTLRTITESQSLRDIRAIDFTHCLVDAGGLADVLRVARRLETIGIQAHDGLLDIALAVPNLLVMTDGVSLGPAATELRRQKRLAQWEGAYFVGSDSAGGVITTT
jgi:uncharacterized protein (TIGR02996 family)